MSPCDNTQNINVPLSNAKRFTIVSYSRLIWNIYLFIQSILPWFAWANEHTLSWNVYFLVCSRWIYSFEFLNYFLLFHCNAESFFLQKQKVCWQSHNSVSIKLFTSFLLLLQRAFCFILTQNYMSSLYRDGKLTKYPTNPDCAMLCANSDVN